MKKIRSSKCLLNVKVLIVPSPVSRSFTECECTLTQEALHSDTNLEIRFRTLTVITIKAVSTLISSQLGFSATDEIDDLEASILNRQGKEQFILASQPPLVPKDPFKQLQHVSVPQAEFGEPAISVRAAIIANFQLLKIDFLE